MRRGICHKASRSSEALRLRNRSLSQYHEKGPLSLPANLGARRHIGRPPLISDAVVLLPKGKHTHTVILMHSMYNQGADFMDVPNCLKLLGAGAGREGIK